MRLFVLRVIMSKTFSYGKKEKLKSRKLLAELFAQKQSFLLFPLKVFYYIPVAALDYPVKAGVGVNSRNFKKAVHRNRIKRLLREGYRLNKLPLQHYLEEKNKAVIVFFLYIDKVLPQDKIIEAKMPAVIHQLIKRLDEQTSQNT